MFINTEQQDLPFTSDTLALFKELASGKDDTVLFESRDSCGDSGIQSLLFLGAALRIEGRGQEVTLFALNDNGQNALDALYPSLSRLGEVDRKNDCAVVQFSSCRGLGSDIERIKAESVLDALRLISFGWRAPDKESIPLRMPGIFSYDLIDHFESLPEARMDKLGLCDFVFWLPDRLAVINHAMDQATVIAHEYSANSTSITDSKISDDIRNLVSFIRSFDITAREGETTETPSSTGHREDYQNQPIEVDLDDSQYGEIVEQCKEHIRAGDVFQIVPSRTFAAPCADPLATFEILRQLNPSPYMFFLNWENFTLLGSSPEACVRVTGTPRKVEIHPIAGTRPRGLSAKGDIDTELDSRYEAELKLNEKELAEHMMLVDLARNDVARVSRPGTRRVARLTEVERYSHVMHLTSVIEGELREDLDALHAYAASMNMGTLVGAPKIEAATLLRRYETDQRGPYGGAVGYLTSDGELDTAIIIRSALVQGGTAYIRAGAGVVFDSDPQAEALETRNKAGAVLQAIHGAKGASR
ncbi:MAG: anthranilate synthase component 1 [Proteobacteria bacterium]|nr:anthranilate synthase component 1 [Pseudomonadota bacterium]